MPSYTALYRKLRPRVFADVIGQDHIVTTLVNQIVSGRVSHAYLFCGTRGTGKTTTAKIFAKAVNCENPAGGEPCNACACCEDIAAGRSLSVLEIDAASNNGVDNIRDIRDEVRYAPTEGKYRVYIIDEVHMLSAGAFNALLKTLEEPPPYVIFILATTDPQKIPATVLSRVQRFDFRRISARDMRETLKAYMAAEGVRADDDALAYVAGISDGAMRDALSILDQCIAFYYGQDVTLPHVLDVVGAVDNQALFNITWALSKYDSAACLTFIDELIAAGRDVGQLVADMIGHFRNLLIAANVRHESTALAVSAETVDRLRAQASGIPQDTLLEYVRAFSELASDMRFAVNQRVMLEVACIKLCNPAASAGADAPEALLRRVRKLEAALAAGAVPGALFPANGEEDAFIPEETEDSVFAPAEADDGAFPPAEAVWPAPPEAAPAAPAMEAPAKPPAREKAGGAPDPKTSAPAHIQAAIDSWEAFAGKARPPLSHYLKAAKPRWKGGNALTLVSGATLDFLKQREGDIQALLAAEFHGDFEIRFLSQESAPLAERDFTDKINGTIIFEDI